jgi:4-amino-4-deoxy-L-arabinose transferase-like glycosyltransferase
MPPARSDTFNRTLDRHWAWALAALVIAAFAIRSLYIGNPLIDADEQFYLLVGDRMLHGALPYIDIWDRKPVGLFLLYAAIRLLGGDGVVQYQLVAAGAAAATAVLIAVLARRIATPGAGLVAGLLYLPLLAMLGGQGGQTPVFYNLPMAVAALILLRQATADQPRSLAGSGALAMLLVGVAIQIKYNAVFEGLYFGLVLLVRARRDGRSPIALAGCALLWIGAALLPTALAWGYYAAIGQGEAFAYANFGSIFERSGVGTPSALANLGHDLVRLAPVLIALGIAELVVRRDASWQADEAGRCAHHFLFGWLVAALIGFALFGTYFNHYALPLLPPLLVVAAPAFAARRGNVGRILAGLSLFVFALWYPLNARHDVAKRGDAAYGYAMAARIKPLLTGGRCLFVFYGAPIYYQLTRSCLPTRWPFPYHLSLNRETAALGVDPAAELARILRTQPAAIIDKLTDDPEINLTTQTMLRAALARDYRLVYTHRFTAGREETDRLWARQAGH